MTSGVRYRTPQRAGDIRASVEDEEYLSIGVVWPSALANPRMLTKKWLVGDGVLQVEDYHPMIKNFYEFLTNFQSHQGEKIMSYCRILLLFAVKPHFEQWVLAWE